MKRIFTLLSVMLALGFQSKAQLVINEVDYDQPSTDLAEFIELYNDGSSSVNLGDYQIILYNGSTTSNLPYDTIALSGTLAAGDYYVIGTTLVANVDLVVSAGATGFIQNGAGPGATGSPDAIGLQVIATSAMADALSYEGDCPSPWVEGTGLSSADSDTLTSDSVAYKYLSIGRFTDGTDSDDNSADFMRMCSTPGAANVNSTTGCSATGLATATKDFSFHAYPNPSKGIVNIDLSSANLKNVSVMVTNVLGTEVKRFELGDFSAIYTIDMADLRNGIYFVKVQSLKGTSAQRIVLTK